MTIPLAVPMLFAFSPSVLLLAFGTGPLRNALILVILSAGNAALWIKYVNWAHSRPLSCGTLHRLRLVHDAMLTIVPILLVLLLEISGPKLLLGGRWSDLNLLMWVFVAIFGVGVFKLIRQIIRHHQSRPVPEATESGSMRINFAEQMEGPKYGPGKHQLLARIPFSEQFLVEFNDKEFRFASLPVEFDGLTLLHISDWHFLGTIPKEFFVRVSRFAAERPVDLVCFTGISSITRTWSVGFLRRLVSFQANSATTTSSGIMTGTRTRKRFATPSTVSAGLMSLRGA